MENSDLRYTVHYRRNHLEKEDRDNAIVVMDENDEGDLQGEEEDTAAKIHELIGNVQ